MVAGLIDRRRRWRGAPAVLLVALIALLVACGVGETTEQFGEPIPGRRVHDRAGALSAAEIRDLEERAAVAAAGAPTVVYLRVREADDEETQRDAGDLAATWGIESAPGARDGVVIFLNLEPGDTRHGQAAIFAGERHYDGGHLPRRELERIFDDEMRPLLADGQLAAGIGAGLDALARSLALGPPPPPAPSPLQRTAGQFARLPLSLLAAVAAVGSLLLAARSWRSRPPRAAAGAPTATRPGDLPPALAGALVARRIDTARLAESTLLDLARRGAVVAEPDDRRSARVRPLDSSVPDTEHERQLWSALAGSTDADGTVSGRSLGAVLARPAAFEEALRAVLVDRGWYDPGVAARRRRLSVAGVVALVAGAAAAAVAAIGQEVWGLPAVGLLLASGVALLLVGHALPETTAPGERAAAHWHAYRAGLERAGREADRPLDLEAALPDAVALGAISGLDKRLKGASEAGYAPSWFVRADPTDPATGFYPIWIALHATTWSPSTGTGGGAATGGGSAGGRF